MQKYKLKDAKHRVFTKNKICVAKPTKNKICYATQIYPFAVKYLFICASVLIIPENLWFSTYIKQDDVEEVVNNNAPYKLGEGKQYRTYMQPDSEIRGWKRYPVRRWEAMRLSKPPARFRGNARENKKTQVKLFPLKEGAQFKSSIRFHNLLPAELGALIWTVTWGNDDRLRHSLGMGKPLGFGQVQFKITDSDIRSLEAPDTPIAFDEKEYVSLFRQLMQKEYTQAQAKQAQVEGKWGDSEQLRQLKAMAYPEHRDATAEKKSVCEGETTGLGIARIWL